MNALRITPGSRIVRLRNARGLWHILGADSTACGKHVSGASFVMTPVSCALRQKIGPLCQDCAMRFRNMAYGQYQFMNLEQEYFVSVRLGEVSRGGIYEGCSRTSFAGQLGVSRSKRRKSKRRKAEAA